MPRPSPALPTLSASARDRVRLSTNRGNNHEYTLGRSDVLMPLKTAEHVSALALRGPRGFRPELVVPASVIP